MVKGNELYLAFVRYVIGFENIRHFVLVPSSLNSVQFHGHTKKL